MFDVGEEEGLFPEGLATACELTLVFVVVPHDYQLFGSKLG